MNKNKNYEIRSNINDYLKTFFTTLFIVLTFGILNIFYMVHSIFNEDINSKRQNIDSSFEAYLVDMLIDKNIDIAKTQPKNYAIDMRLGILYSYKRDYKNAEKYFKNSIEKVSVYDYAPTYQLAKLYIKTGNLQDAQALMDNIGEKPNKRLIRFKADIYDFLGDAYYNQGYYALSAIKYEKSLSYYSILGKKHTSKVKNKYANALTSLADKYVETGKNDEAIMSLENAYELNPNDVILNYKLGLLYADNNPYKALDLFSYVLKKNPQKINYDMYVDLLQNLSDIENNKGNYTNSELYYKRIGQYKKFVKNNLLYNKDLFIDIKKSEIKTDIAAKEFILTIQFTLQNNSDLDIDNLTINAIVKDNGKVIQNFNQKIYDDLRIFKAGTVSPPLIVSASEPYKNRRSGSLDIEVYAYKYPKYTVKLYSASIPKPPVEE
ncbi:tetratricopeptide repeat protein [bacterium]|nr:tetratricopeptide repeat protein [bacterium]